MTVRVWDVNAGHELNELPAQVDPVYGVAFSFDDRYFAWASADQTVKIWDRKTRQEKLPLRGHSRSVTNVAFSRDSQRLASYSNDEGVMKLWDVETGQELLSLSGLSRGKVSGLAFSPDANRIAVGDSTTVRVWDATPR